MFGLDSFGIWFVYLLCIISAALCIVYGVFNWNKGADIDDDIVVDEELMEKDE